MDMALDLDARFTLKAGETYVEFERDLDHTPEAVWQALTDKALLPNWLAPGEIELTPGGSARLDFGDSGIVIDSIVSACEAPRRLEYSWSAPSEGVLRPLRWRLEEEPGGCRLSLTLVLPAEEDSARSAAGWAAHLDMLAAALAGVPIKFPFERFKSARELYRLKLEALTDQPVA